MIIAVVLNFELLVAIFSTVLKKVARNSLMAKPWADQKDVQYPELRAYRVFDCRPLLL